MKEVLKAIIKQFGYGGTIDKMYYARMGTMANRYGKDIVIQAANSLHDKKFEDKNLPHLLSAIEKVCQQILRNDKTEIDWEKI